MNKVYLGSINRIKLEAVKTVFNDLLVEGVKIDSGVSLQPIGIDETIKGAINRANGLPNDGLRIGLEAGVLEIRNELFLINFGVLLANEKIFYAGGTMIPLPKEVSYLINKEKMELKDAMNKVYKVKNINEDIGTIGFLTENYVKRVDIFIHICKLLKGQYLRSLKDE